MPHLNSEVANLTRHLQTGDTRQKFTIRVNLPDGKSLEWQADSAVSVQWNDSLREKWLVDGTYHGGQIMPWQEGMIIISERNKDVKD